MGRKRAREEDTAGGDGGRKHHKKAKHHHRKRKARSPEEEGGDEGGRAAVVGESPSSRPIKLKIKLRGKVVGRATATAAISPGDDDSLFGATSGSPVESESLLPTATTVGGNEWEEESDLISVGAEGGGGVLSNSDREEGVEEEEEEEEELDEEDEWLNALESGAVNERGYLPPKEAAVLTARQKAMLGSSDSELLQLPLNKTKIDLTEEMLLRKNEKNRKRRLAAQKRKERKKAETVRKLIEKQTKKKDDKSKPPSKPRAPHVRYVNRVSSCSLSLPPGLDFPLQPQTAAKPPQPKLCAVDGCVNPRKYSDAQSGCALCSLQCYQQLRAANAQTRPLRTKHVDSPT